MVKQLYFLTGSDKIEEGQSDRSLSANQQAASEIYLDRKPGRRLDACPYKFGNLRSLLLLNPFIWLFNAHQSRKSVRPGLSS